MWVKEPRVPWESRNGRIYVYPNRLLDELDINRLYVPMKQQWSTPSPNSFQHDLTGLRRADVVVFECVLRKFRKKKDAREEKLSSVD